MRQSPDVLLIISDDHRWCDSGCYDSADAQTPNIDRIAREGMRLDRYYTVAPLPGAFGVVEVVVRDEHVARRRQPGFGQGGPSFANLFLDSCVNQLSPPLKRWADIGSSLQDGLR